MEFKNIRLTLSPAGWITSPGDQAILTINDVDYTTLLVNSGVTDGSAGIDGDWSTEQASSFSIMPSSPASSKMRIISLTVEAPDTL